MINNIKNYLTILLALICICGCSTANRPQQLIVETPSSMPEHNFEDENIEVALVLGAGGSRSIAHIGVLKAFEEHNIPIDLVVGTSGGSFVGSLYADGKSSDEIKDSIMPLELQDIFDFTFEDKMSFYYTQRAEILGLGLQNFINDNISVKEIQNLQKPFISIATDFETMDALEIKSGPVVTAVHSSSALPGIFKPVSVYGTTLIDGGVVQPVPVDFAKKYSPKLTIAVNISRKNEIFTQPKDILERTNALTYYKLSCLQAALADVVIHPDLREFSIFEDEIGKKEIIYQRGYSQAMEMMPAIKQKLCEDTKHKNFCNSEAM